MVQHLRMLAAMVQYLKKLAAMVQYLKMLAAMVQYLRILADIGLQLYAFKKGPAMRQYLLLRDHFFSLLTGGDTYWRCLHSYKKRTCGDWPIRYVPEI
jgi:hypothetical protein